MIFGKKYSNPNSPFAGGNAINARRGFMGYRPQAVDPMTGLSWAESMRAPAGSGLFTRGSGSFQGMKQAYPQSQGGTETNVLTRLMGMKPRSWMDFEDTSPFGQWLQGEKRRLGMLPDYDPLEDIKRRMYDSPYSLLR
jgi:hypothetical protein